MPPKRPFILRWKTLWEHRKESVWLDDKSAGDTKEGLDFRFLFAYSAGR